MLQRPAAATAAATAAVSFLSREETAAFIARDRDKYLASLTAQDLCARGHVAIAPYVDAACRSAAAFTEAERARCTDACSEVDARLWAAPMALLPGRHIIPPARLAQLPWRLALTSGKAYEGGLPHTRLDTIFLTREAVGAHARGRLVELLTHEKAHIFQRYHATALQEALELQGYEVVGLRANVRGARANPDLDPFVYRDPRRRLLLATYACARPLSIGDVVYHNTAGVEHPNEEIAYALAASVASGRFWV
jgi:hypothetical protein